MKVIYVDILDDIRMAVEHADRYDKTISHIVVTDSEWRELFARLPDRLAELDVLETGRMLWFGVKVVRP